MNFQIFLLLSASFYFSTGSSQNKQLNFNDSKLSSIESQHQTLDSNLQFKAVLTAYLELKNALVADDANTASSSGKSLMSAIDAMDMKKMNAKQHTVWMKYSEKLSYDAEHIKNTPETEHQREHFISLSKNFYQVAKVFNANPDDLYYQFCPMANDGKGAYWLSEQSKVRNPYYGKKMLSCGSTKETLPAVKK